MAQKHYFPSTAQAYDACQCDDSIKKGDLLVIESEKVVGIADTWPVAVTDERGSLHQFCPIYSDQLNADMMGIDISVIEQARAFARTAFAETSS